VTSVDEAKAAPGALEAPPAPRPVSPVPAAARRPRPGPLLVRPIVIYAASRLVTLAAMATSTVISHRSLGEAISLWDSRWFLLAARSGWPDHVPTVHGQPTRSVLAFFPLFPLAIRGLAALTGMSLLAAGILVSMLSGLCAIGAIWWLVREYAGPGAADRAAVLVAFFPAAFVFSLVYSEGFLLTFVALSLLALLRRRWVWAGVSGALASAVSPIGLVLVLSGAWAAWRGRGAGSRWRPLVAPLLTPLGFVAVQCWLWSRTGDLWAWHDTEVGGWHSSLSLRYPLHVVGSFVTGPLAANKTDDLLVAGTVLTVALGWVAVRTRPPVPVLLYGLGAAALALVAAPIGLRPRFVLIAFPLVAALGVRLHGRAFAGTALLSGTLLVVLTVFTLSSFAIFP
jgi:hypothetical protein